MTCKVSEAAPPGLDLCQLHAMHNQMNKADLFSHRKEEEVPQGQGLGTGIRWRKEVAPHWA